MLFKPHQVAAQIAIYIRCRHFQRMMLEDLLHNRGICASRYADRPEILLESEQVISRGFQSCATGPIRGQECAINIKQKEFHSSESSSSSGSGGSSSVGGANLLFRLLAGSGEIVIPMLLPISFGSISACPIEERSSLRRCINWNPSSL